MKAYRSFRDKYLLSTLIISAVVAVLTHFPEVLSLSDHFEQHALFPGINPVDVLNEILFTFLSLLFLFWINARIFRFGTSLVRVTKGKITLSFLLTWAFSSLLGQLFVWLHHRFDIPAIDAMVHHYLHPLRDLIIAGIIAGSNQIIHLIHRQQCMVVENEELHTESVRHQYESLKNQLNPHMLFNSLNTLQSLIRESPPKALEYTQELSRVLRYSLQDNDQQSVTLAEEMQRSEAYMFLMKMRYEENLVFDIDIDAALSGLHLPPMSVQLLIENAIKHNEISNRNPLTISIRSESGPSLVVRNRIQAKRQASPGPGIGLDNLAKRYRLLWQQEIQISTDEEMFCVRIPLHQPDNAHESTHH
ncbi:histidine kinase [Alistipes sp.]|uniref:sensor histidine kinase n=1 Tax=Alistipes sp. TaxID=1872444 RepID=UPI0025C61B2C|nr:histidine kinase [Alistipes sp.]